MYLQVVTGRRLINTQLANCIRFLSVDAILKAKSGHPGMPLGMADIMTVLFREVLRHDPSNPGWVNRDRVVLSNGHGSMLLYAALYLSGYDWTIEELQNFRQLGYDTCGHPEYDVKKGVEVTTGPLGQGLANAAGMALAAKRLGKEYGSDKIDYHTFCFVGDGCLMEGISHEVGAIIPKLLSDGLTVIWDDNGISIDGEIEPWFEQDVLSRFASYGFEVIENVDGHDHEAILTALMQARSARKPTFIQMKTVIGKGCSAVEGTAAAHGQPVSAENIQVMREALDWPHAPFEIPENLLSLWDMRPKAKAYDTSWVLPKESLPIDQLYKWLEETTEESMATRKASAMVLQQIAPNLPTLIGGSADLKASNLTGLPTSGSINGHQYEHQYIDFGVREFAMFAIANGLALSSLVPFVSTFMTFMDYGRNALRMSALMKLRVIYVLTHDSIGVGEDGPTHQPIEHLTMCRVTPGVRLWRPCNLQETTAAWLNALRYQGPTVLALSRQSFGVLERKSLDAVEKGAYLRIEAPDAQATILASGSEVAIAEAVAEALAGDNILVNVISCPCLELLPESGLDECLLKRDQRFAIEASEASSFLRWVPHEHIFGIQDYGKSAPADKLYNAVGLTKKKIADKIKKRLAK